MEQGVQVRHGVLMLLGSFGGIITNLLGGWDVAMRALVIFMSVDFLTGLVVAGVFRRSGKSKTGALESGSCFKGICRKLGMLSLVVLSSYLDQMMGSSYIRSAVIMFFVVNEGLSILENTALMGVPYPKALKTALEALQDKEKNTEQ